MDPNFKKGSVFIPLLLALSISGFILVKSILTRTFTDAQIDVEAGIQQRYDPYSTRYSLSKHMGAIDTWRTHESKLYNYQITHPNVWKQTERTFPGTLEFYEVGLGDDLNLSVAVQVSFVEANHLPEIETSGNIFSFLQDEKSKKAAVIQKNNLYYIIRLKQDNYFGSEQEFKNSFFQILTRIDFN